jgi:GMP synthase (glutamine-hydrolysing)
MGSAAPASLRYLLLQIRNQDDPMRWQEVDCFAEALGCRRRQIRVFDLLSGVPRRGQLDPVDMVLLGGSGHYSAAGQGPWLDRALESMRRLCELDKPTFASCWGFQAMARALGGRVIHDPDRAELGTHQTQLTQAGIGDPIFGPLGKAFLAPMGHTDRVVDLPPGAIHLARSERVENQAFRLDGRPIYCTQFHPELSRKRLLERVQAYPEYIRISTGMSMQQFVDACQETPKANALLRRFVQQVFQ